MPLPKHVNLADCVPDPSGRANHIYHVPTDEVLHVDKQTAQKVAKTSDKDYQTMGLRKPEPTGMTLAPQTPQTEPTGVQGEIAAQGETQGLEADTRATIDLPDHAELLEMAQNLDIPVTDAMTDEYLQTLIERAIGGADAADAASASLSAQLPQTVHNSSEGH